MSCSAGHDRLDRTAEHRLERVHRVVVGAVRLERLVPVSYTHLRAHETVLDLVCRLLLEKKNKDKHTRTDAI